MIAGLRDMAEVERNKELMVEGPSHRRARYGSRVSQGRLSPERSPDAPLILLASSMRIETAAVPRPGSMRPHWTMPRHPRYVHLLCPIRTIIQACLILPAACLTQSRCALVLKLLVVDVTGVGAGHVESVPVMPCQTVRSGMPPRPRYR
ncbi:hypothetical protein FJTKL_10662 [Diaporthe vaccinii]|uniref:Uncharacterized protein n=1 Tax=Diaporthe vaccinii TaxID=105482 RepID=A0ABR4FB97_9PEZI